MLIRVEIDVTKPLKRKKRLIMGPTSVVVDFAYERLQIFCFVCGRIGHSKSFCDEIFMAEGSEVK